MVIQAPLLIELPHTQVLLNGLAGYNLIIADVNVLFVVLVVVESVEV